MCTDHQDTKAFINHSEVYGKCSQGDGVINDYRNYETDKKKITNQKVFKINSASYSC